MAQQPTEIKNPAAASKDGGNAKLRPFKVVRVEKTDAPEGGHGREWYRYVLDSGRSTITGQRCGSRKDVLAYAAQCADQLNARGLTGQSIWSPRGRKPASTSST